MPKRMTIPEIFKALENTPKKLEKLDILQKEKDNESLKRVFEYALNPYKQYGIKKIPAYETRRVQGFTINSVLKRLDALAEKQVSGNKAIEFLSKLLSELPEDEAEIVSRIIRKDMRCGVQAKTVNKVWPNLIPEYPCMLCNGYNDDNMKHITYPALAQVKMDGMRINFLVSNGVVEARARSGKEVDLKGLFDYDMLAIAGNQNMVLDGELLVSDGNGGFLSRKKGNGIINKAIKGTISKEEAELVVAVLWDAVLLSEFKTGSWNFPYEKRWNWLKGAVNNIDTGRTRLVKSKEIDSPYFARRMFDEVVAEGGEGIIIKNKDSIWENKRSKHQVKMKVENEADLIITDIIEGTGKYEGLLGSFLLETSDGQLEVSVGSGFSDEEREKYYTKSLIGSVVAVKYNEVIQRESDDKRSLFLPIFVEIRTDKNEANSLQELK